MPKIKYLLLTLLVCISLVLAGCDPVDEPQTQQGEAENALQDIDPVDVLLQSQDGLFDTYYLSVRLKADTSHYGSSIHLEYLAQATDFMGADMQMALTLIDLQENGTGESIDEDMLELLREMSSVYYKDGYLYLSVEGMGIKSPFDMQEILPVIAAVLESSDGYEDAALSAIQDISIRESSRNGYILSVVFDNEQLLALSKQLDYSQSLKEDDVVIDSCTMTVTLDENLKATDMALNVAMRGDAYGEELAMSVSLEIQAREQGNHDPLPIPDDLDEYLEV